MLIHKLPQTPYTVFPLDWQVWAPVYSAFSIFISWRAMDLVGKPNTTSPIWIYLHACHPSAFVQVSSSSPDRWCLQFTWSLASLRCESSGAAWGKWVWWRLSPSRSTHVASRRCGSSGALWSCGAIRSCVRTASKQRAARWRAFSHASADAGPR